MQISLILSLILLSVAISARTSLKDSCGAGTVTNEHTVTHEGHDIKIITSSCPGFATLRNVGASAAPSASKRQVIAGSCDGGFDCSTSGLQPNIFDCEHIAEALTSLGTEQFNAPNGTLTTFSLATCTFGFANLDTIPYVVSYSNVGLTGDSVVVFCSDNDLTVVTAGLCLSPLIPGDDWVIEAVHS